MIVDLRTRAGWVAWRLRLARARWREGHHRWQILVARDEGDLDGETAAWDRLEHAGHARGLLELAEP